MELADNVDDGDDDNELDGPEKGGGRGKRPVSGGLPGYWQQSNAPDPSVLKRLRLKLVLWAVQLNASLRGRRL
jgi:hypothetical protein